MYKADKENIVTCSTMTQENLYWLRTTTRVRLNHAAFDAGWHSIDPLIVVAGRGTHKQQSPYNVCFFQCNQLHQPIISLLTPEMGHLPDRISIM